MECLLITNWLAVEIISSQPRVFFSKSFVNNNLIWSDTWNIPYILILTVCCEQCHHTSSPQYFCQECHSCEEFDKHGKHQPLRNNKKEKEEELRTATGFILIADWLKTAWGDNKWNQINSKHELMYIEENFSEQRREPSNSTHTVYARCWLWKS